MLILDQGKMALLNLDHIVRISVEGQSVYVRQAHTEETTIGVYKSQQRATEVLAEIVSTYGSYIIVQGKPLHQFVQPMAFNPSKVYTMPEE